MSTRAKIGRWAAWTAITIWCAGWGYVAGHFIIKYW